MSEDKELAALRKAYREPWEFERTPGRRIKATHLGYSVTGDNAGQVSRSISEWMSNTGLTGDGGMTVEQLGRWLAEPGF